jgi:hypothetical protein
MVPVSRKLPVIGVQKTGGSNEVRMGEEKEKI